MNPERVLPTLALLFAVVANGQAQPVITTEPQDQTNHVGTTAAFSITASGTQPLDYQWQFNASDLVGLTNSTIVLSNVQPGNAGPYTVVVTNVTGAVTSTVATLTVLVPPLFLRLPPTNTSVSVGASVTFIVSASGTPPFSYHWLFNQVVLLGDTNSNLVLTDLQMTNAGGYTVVVTNPAGSATSAVAYLEVDPTFTKITTGSIVTDLGYGIGCAWGDYDNDGFVDLFVTTAAEFTNVGQKNVLFHNNGDGTFNKITNSVITSEARDWRGCAWADYDNDGNLDLFVTSTDANGFPAQNELFRNNGDGTFTKMTAASVGAIVSLSAGGSEGAVWADYDNDGFLDLFVARYGPDWLFHNNGDGTFARMTNSLPPDNQDSYWAAWGDYNNDGRPDLFVTVQSDPPTNLLYLNVGGGNFKHVTSGSIATDSGHSFGCAWGDYDNDGYLDLFVSHGGYVGSETSSLFHNNRDGTFTRMTSNTVGSIANDAGAFTGCAWGDYDNDGFIDLFVTTYNGCLSLGANYLFHNNGDGSFTRVLSGSLVNDKGYAVACAWSDYDNDGFLDLFVARGPCVPAGNLLYRNNGNSNGWLKVKLVGTASNRSAVGAKVRVNATIGGRSLWQLREINTGQGLNANPLEAHFGLGDATNIDLVRIEWPSGIVQTLTNVAPRQFLTVVEHQDNPRGPVTFTGAERLANGAIQLSANGSPRLLYVFEVSTNLIDWTKLGVRSGANGTAGLTDLKATNSTSRFYRVSIP